MEYFQIISYVYVHMLNITTLLSMSDLMGQFQKNFLVWFVKKKVITVSFQCITCHKILEGTIMLLYLVSLVLAICWSKIRMFYFFNNTNFCIIVYSFEMNQIKESLNWNIVFDITIRLQISFWMNLSEWFEQQKS